MPQLDVTDILLDPDFADVIHVTRRPYTIDVNGRPVITPQLLCPIGVITQGTPKGFEQQPDAQVGKAMITVHAFEFQFYEVETGKASSFQPDLITYNGSIYTVTKVYNWSRYGKGFTACQAELYDVTEAGR